ncbi:hypothetical protein EZV62_028119 [Acer yangbiense]|uniref:Uncharacterized protein n=1 Tax=Acer yangbiense TaxID=1000413 RepID=A0A5C7GP98_9ROSI|nr:hypothetical protein EZV62_028119 [Acer yangbiense]
MSLSIAASPRVPTCRHMYSNSRSKKVARRSILHTDSRTQLMKPPPRTVQPGRPKKQRKREPAPKVGRSGTTFAVPCVDGLPPGTKTTADVPYPLHSLVMTAMDLTEPAIEAILSVLKPDFVLYDFTHWLPPLAHKLGIKAIIYCTVSSATIGYLVSPERKLREKILTEADLLKPPPSFPSSKIKLRAHKAQGLAAATVKQFGGIPFTERQLLAFSLCDAISFKTYKEIEGPYCDYLGSQFEKPVILAGPVLPKPPRSVFEEK